MSGGSRRLARLQNCGKAGYFQNDVAGIGVGAGLRDRNRAPTCQWCVVDHAQFWSGEIRSENALSPMAIRRAIIFNPLSHREWPLPSRFWRGPMRAGGHRR